MVKFGDFLLSNCMEVVEAWQIIEGHCFRNFSVAMRSTS